MITNKQIYYFLFTTVLFFVFTKAASNSKITSRIGQNFAYIGASVAFSAVAFAVFATASVCSVTSTTPPSVTKDDFTFEVSPEKKCCDGDYMLSAEDRAYCATLSQGQMDKFCCGGAMTTGKPYDFEYTPEGDLNGNNLRCGA